MGVFLGETEGIYKREKQPSLACFTSSADCKLANDLPASYRLPTGTYRLLLARASWKQMAQISKRQAGQLTSVCVRAAHLLYSDHVCPYFMH